MKLSILCSATTVLAVIALNLLAFACHFDMARNVGLSGTGLNNACQNASLSTLDQSVCVEGRLSDLFLIYTDGSPFLFYEALLSVPKYRDISIAKISENPGINDSGPSFRSSAIGRFDIDYVSDLRQLDNHLHQFLRNSGSPMEVELYFQFPILPNMQDASFAKVHLSPDHNEGLTELCTEFFVNHPFPSNLGCVDPLACQFESEASALQFVAEETEKYVAVLEPKKPLLQKCLDAQFRKNPSLFVYQEKTDDLAHSWSIKNKVTSTLQAKSLANLRAVIDYLLDSRPDTLIAVYSDHGQAKEMWDDEWVNHGYPSGKNNGFLLLINERLRHKRKPPVPAFESADTLFSQMTLLLRNANLPKYQKHLPGAWFLADDFENLKTLRAREMQMAEVLGTAQFEASPFRSLDPTLGLSENIRRMGSELVSALSEEYEGYLQSKESQFEARVSQIRSPYAKLQLCFSCLVFALDLLLVFRLFAASEGRERLPRWPFAVLGLWFCLLMALNPIGCYRFPVVSSLFLCLLLAAAKVPVGWQRLHRLLTALNLVASDGRDQLELDRMGQVIAVLACLPLAVGAGFLLAYQLDVFKHVIYFLSAPWEVAGMVCTTLSTGLLILCLFTDRSRMDQQQLRHWVTKTRLDRIAAVVAAAVLAYMLLITARYESTIFKNSSLHHDRSQMLLVQQMYWCLAGLMLLASCALQARQSRLVCLATAYVFFSFWSTHLSRVLYSVVVIPAIVWVSRKQPSDLNFGMLWAAVSVLGAGLYTANGEAYLFTVSQRAFKRHPMENPDRDLLPTIINTFFIKFGSSIVMQLFLQLAKPPSLAKKREAAYLLSTVALYIPCSYVMSSNVASQQTFLVFLGANIIVPFVVMMHRWAVDAVSELLLHDPSTEKMIKYIDDVQEEESITINMQQTSIMVNDEEMKPQRRTKTPSFLSSHKTNK